MSTNETDRRQEAALAPFFEAARAQAPEPSPDLLARVLADAEAAQAQPVARRPVPRSGLWTRIAQGLGGWPGLTGLGAAALAGLWIGLAMPATLPGITEGPVDYVVDIAPDMALGTGEGF